jgi:hypothetical protein
VIALSFEMVDARPAAHAAVPTILFRLRVNEHSGALIHAMVLRVQVRIEPQRRPYSPDEEDRLYELFGDTPQWGDSLRPFLWTHATCTTSGFGGAIEADLPVECSYDFEVAGAKYMHSLSHGDIPLVLLFSGTVFTRGQSGFSAEPIGWEHESQFRLPVRVWRELMDQYFPHSGWIRLDRDVFDALRRYKSRRALPTWDQAVEQLLKGAEATDEG